MRAQIAITRNGITKASSDNSPPEGGVPARRTNGDFLISLHRHMSETALSQHLARLRRANIIRMRRESQTVYYSIDDSDVLRILRLLGHIYTDDPVMQRTRH